MSPQIFQDKFQVLQEGLNTSMVKNRVISSNIANIETPGYKSFKVVMSEKLGEQRPSKGALARTHPGHITGSRSSDGANHKIVRDDRTTMRVDGNNVDLESELAEMSANSIYYTALSRFLSKNFAGLRLIISEGRR